MKTINKKTSMLTVTHNICVKYFYEVDELLIKVEISAQGTCKSIDNNGVIDRYMVDLDWESVTWNKHEFSTVKNKIISDYIFAHRYELKSILSTKLLETITRK